MKQTNCPYKGDMCFLYGNCEECSYYKSMQKNRRYRKTIKEINAKNAELQKQVDELTDFKNQVTLFGLYGAGLGNGRKQAVKDTAKEIWNDCIDKIMRGCGDDKEFWVVKILVDTFKKFGVEVE